MARLKVVNVFQGASGLPKDEFENGFHFQTATGAAAAGTSAEYATAAARVMNFYGPGTELSASDKIVSYLSAYIENVATIKVYDYTGGAVGKDGEAITGPPAAVYTYVPGILTDSIGYPSEVALCLSYFSLSNSARHRGRVYIGPFSVVAEGPGSPGIANPDLMTAMQMAGEFLADATTTPGTAGLTAVSPAGAVPAGIAGVNWMLRSNVGTGTKAAPAPTWEQVTHGWVDNEWDTQRRRRVVATARVTF
jgi:hypothetical protein